MILGEFGPTGQPFVEGYLTLPRFGIARNIVFLVDTGAYATCIHPRDGTLAAIPFDQLENPVTSNGVGGPATYFSERAVLEFVDGEAREIRSCEVDVLIAKPAADPMHSINRLPSLLGQGHYRPLAHGVRPGGGRAGIHGEERRRRTGQRVTAEWENDCSSPGGVSLTTGAGYCAYINACRPALPMPVCFGLRIAARVPLGRGADLSGITVNLGCSSPEELLVKEDAVIGTATAAPSIGFQ